MRERVLESIRLGLDEIRRLNVVLGYTNIAVLDIKNSCLGGELLNDRAIAERGYKKLRDWMEFTSSHGTTLEFNSPTYTRVTLGALNDLIEMVRDEETRVVARTMRTRLALSVALRIHRGTGRWAGPHSRAYHPTVVCAGSPEVLWVRSWIANGRVPGWIGRALDGPQLPMQVTETASKDWKTELTTYHSPSFALGVSTRPLSQQSDVFMVHYTRPGASRPGVVYSRYLIDEKWFGDSYHPTDRTRSRNLNDEGRFLGVQWGPRAIGMYAPRSKRRNFESAKATLIWTQRELVDEIWVGDRRIERLPADVPRGTVVVVGSGDALVAVLPLTITDLGRDAPLRLVEIQGDLVLEMYNYKGPRNTASSSISQPQCGFYAQVAERAHHADGKAFGELVARGVVKDHAETPLAYLAGGEQLWAVEYARDGKVLGIEIDLVKWELKRRWTQDGELGWPMLESPVARQTGNGRVVVRDAVLECGESPAWLFADPETSLWAAGYHGEPAPLALTVPGGKVEIESMGAGTVVWENGAVSVDAVGLEGTPTVVGGKLAE